MACRKVWTLHAYMDPVTAYRKQQERLGYAERKDSKERVKTVSELRGEHPRWAAAFDLAGGEKEGGSLKKEGAMKAFHRALGADLPERRLGAGFRAHATGPSGEEKVDFPQFCSIAEDVIKYMSEHPKWAKEEEAAAEEEEKQARLERRRVLREKSQPAPDIFEILGVNKTKDILDLEARKEEALQNAAAHSAERSSFKVAGNAVLGVQRATRGIGGRLDKRAVTIEAVVQERRPSTPALPKDRFTLTQGRKENTRLKELVLLHSVELPKDLPQLKIRRNGAACFALRFSPDGAQLAGGFYDGGLRIYNIDNGQIVHCMNLPKSKGGTQAGPDEKYTAALAELGARDHIEAEERFNPLRSLRAVQEPAVTNLCWRPGWHRSRGVATIATADSAGQLTLFEVPVGRDPRQPRSVMQMDGLGSLYTAAFSEDGNRVLAAGAERLIRVYDMEAPPVDGALRQLLVLGQKEGSHSSAVSTSATGHTSRIMTLCAHPVNSHVMFSGGMDKKVLLWDFRTGTHPVGEVGGVEFCGDSMDISKDGNSLLVGSHRTVNPLQVLDVRSLVPHLTHPAAPRRPSTDNDTPCPTTNYEWRGDDTPFADGKRPSNCLLFSAAWDWANRYIVAAGENDNLARVYERQEDPAVPLQVVGTVSGGQHAFWSAAIAPEGGKAAFGGADGSIAIVGIRRRTDT